MIAVGPVLRGLELLLRASSLKTSRLHLGTWALRDGGEGGSGGVVSGICKTALG